MQLMDQMSWVQLFMSSTARSGACTQPITLAWMVDTAVNVARYSHQKQPRSLSQEDRVTISILMWHHGWFLHATHRVDSHTYVVSSGWEIQAPGVDSSGFDGIQSALRSAGEG